MLASLISAGDVGIRARTGRGPEGGAMQPEAQPDPNAGTQSGNAVSDEAVTG